MADNLQRIKEEFIQAIGSLDNIKAIEHCATRLRFIVKEESIVNTNKLKAIPSAKGYFYQTGQHQIIFGTGLVNKVYATICQGEASLQSSLTSIKEEIYQSLNPIQKLSRVFGDIFIPIIPIVVVTGLFMGIRGLLQSLNIPISENGLIISQVLTDTAFIFLPAFVVWSAFNKFGGTPILGFLSGLMLVSPSLPNAWAVASGSAEPLMLSMGGLQIPVVGFQGSIIAPLFIGWTAAWVEKKARQFVPDILALLAVPLIVISFVILMGHIVLGPMLHSLETAISVMLKNFVGLPFGIGGAIIGAVNQALVITGLHHTFGAIELSLLNVLGYNPLNAIISGAMGGMIGAGFAVALTKKDPKERGDAFALITPAFFGITEPLLFGLTLPNGKVFLSGLVGGGIAGWLAGLFQLKATGLGLTYLPGLSLYLGTGDIYLYILVCLTGIISGFLLAKPFAK